MLLYTKVDSSRGQDCVFDIEILITKGGIFCQTHTSRRNLGRELVRNMRAYLKTLTNMKWVYTSIMRDRLTVSKQVT